MGTLNIDRYHAAMGDASYKDVTSLHGRPLSDAQATFYVTQRKLPFAPCLDVGDALQGFINDKGAGKREPIIPNDNQIYRLTAEKRLPSKRYPDALSTITIRPYDRDARTVADPRETRKHP